MTSDTNKSIAGGNIVRWAILGAGNIAEQFAQDILHAPSAELVCIAARDPLRARTFADRFNIATVADSYDALYSNPNVDAIYIATPHTLHFEQSKRALESGKAVLCEKPISVNADQCNDLIDVAKKQSVFLMEALWTYFLPAIRQAKNWVEEGRIGAVQQIKADFGYPMLPYDPHSRVYNPELAGGCLLDMGIYPIAIAWYFAQQAPSAIHCVAQFAPNGVEDELDMLFDYDGVTASLSTSFKCKLPNHCFVIGEKGYIEIADFWRASECYLYQGEQRVAEFNDGRLGQGFEFEIESASQAILAGHKENSIMPLQTSLELQKHMDAVRTCIERSTN